MDSRRTLAGGTVLPFPGMACRIEKSIGRGSNALVYQGSYEDATTVSRRHRVLIKELFPWDPQGHIWRDENGAICRDAQGARTWETHRASFERGNEVHLDLLSRRPDQVGGNVNTFSLNGTLYTLLDDTDSRSLEERLRDGQAKDLSGITSYMTGLLDALALFHQRGYLHLDISPDNILLTGSGDQERLALIDFNSVHTREEIAQGSALYFSEKEGFAAPEITTGMHSEIGASTDLYAVAAVFYRCLMGRTLTSQEAGRRVPPDGQDSPLLTDSPETVKAQVRKILRKGLNTLPEKRYQSCDEMRQDFTELENRIAGRGVSHAALWEAGRRIVQKLVRENPSLTYLGKEGELYPVRIQWKETGEELDISHLTELEAQENGAPILLSGAGGLGKTTTLYRSVLFSGGAFSPASPARMCIPLSPWKPGTAHFLLDSILRDLKFSQNTRTLEDARHQLRELLSRPVTVKGKKLPVLILLLDGLNEVSEDPAELLEEIRQLSALPGLRIMLTSRSVPEGFMARMAEIQPLREEEVSAALSRHGLLMPEAAEMKALLKTPLMLSLFIQTAEAQAAQVYCGTQRELIQGYLTAICEKTAREEQETRYRSDAAIRLVLPAIAREMDRQHRPLGDAELLDTVLKCRKQLQGRVLAKAFPEWIGHGEEITGTRETSGESWYGLIVQQLLWRRLGLLTRDEYGKYHVMHETLRDELVRISEENQTAIRRARYRKGAAIFSAAMCLMLLALGVYEIWLKPKPYHEGYAKATMDNMAWAYSALGMDYERMTSLLDAAEQGEEAFTDKWEIIQSGQNPMLSSYNEPNALCILQKMLHGEDEKGSFMPWSGLPLDEDSATNLLTLPQQRSAEYERYMEVLSNVVTDSSMHGLYYQQYAGLLRQLANLDAKITAALFQMACRPHVVGIYDDGSATARTFDGLFQTAVAQNRVLIDMDRDRPVRWLSQGEYEKTLSDLRGDLSNYEQDRQNVVNAISICGVMDY